MKGATQVERNRWGKYTAECAADPEQFADAREWVQAISECLTNLVQSYNLSAPDFGKLFQDSGRGPVFSGEVHEAPARASRAS